MPPKHLLPDFRWSVRRQARDVRAFATARPMKHSQLRKNEHCHQTWGRRSSNRHQLVPHLPICLHHPAWRQVCNKQSSNTNLTFGTTQTSSGRSNAIYITSTLKIRSTQHALVIALGSGIFRQYFHITCRRFYMPSNDQPCLGHNHLLSRQALSVFGYQGFCAGFVQKCETFSSERNTQPELPVFVR